MLFDLQLFAEGDELIAPIVDHAEQIGQHAERLDALAAGQEAIATVAAGAASSVELVRADIANLSSQISDGLSSVHSRIDDLTPKVEEQQTVPETEKTEETTETKTDDLTPPDEVTPENKKEKSGIAKFFEFLR